MSDLGRQHALRKLRAFALDVIEQIAGTQESDGGEPDGDVQQPRSQKTRKRGPLVVKVVRARAKAHEPRSDEEKEELDHPQRLHRTAIECPRTVGQRELAMLLKVVDAAQSAIRQNVDVTKRDIFYRDVALFRTQASVDRLFDDLSVTLEVRRDDMNIVAAAKGLFQGHLTIHSRDGSNIAAHQTPMLIPVGDAIMDLTVPRNVRFVLVVEKEAVFSTLVNLGFTDDATLGPSIILTGKGYPDIATRRLLRLLSSKLPPHVPLLCLVDADPHGIDILSTYRLGSANRALAGEGLAVETLEWIGVKGSEWDSMCIDRDALLRLEPADRKRALALLARPDLPREWTEELCIMLHRQRKAEIQMLEGARLVDYLRDRILAIRHDPIHSQTATASQDSMPLDDGAADDLLMFE